LARDVRAARQVLIDEGVPGKRLLYYGESLGAAVVAEPVCARTCVAEGPFPGSRVRCAGRRADHCRVRHRGLHRSPWGKPTVGRCRPRATRLVAVQGADHNDPALLNADVLVQAVVELANEINRKQ
jgi:uncharacterized protein